jgi:glutamate---cysteine ligase / carboxylate-amine ligase
MTTHPTFGVEEEFLLVDPDSGDPAPLNRAVAEHASRSDVDLQLELTSCQVETASNVATSTTELRSELLRLRRVAADSATAAGARLLAVSLPPTVPHEFPITDKPRYNEIAERFGMIAHEQGISGCHVHVAVPDREKAVKVSNRLRPWLPSLLALTANSAIYRVADTGYASWRSVLWARWPSAGPPPHFDSLEDYDATVRMMLDEGAMLDDGMVYWDVRPSANYPTVELRVADVPATVAETVLLATLARALVMTALEDERRGEPFDTPTPHQLRVAYWKAARYGLVGSAELLTELIERVTPALDAVGDLAMVRSEFGRLLTEGNGAMRQQRAWARRNDVADVIEEAATATLSGV